MRSRFWSAGLPALVLAGAACATRPPIPEGGELIPADATFALSLDVEAIKQSELYRRYEQDETFFGRNRINFYRFAEATGLNPARDIRRLIFVARASGEGLAEMSAIAIGTFDGRKVHEFLKDQRLPSREVSGMEIFEFLVIEGRCRFCVAVVDSSTAAFGDGETLAKIAQARTEPSAALASQERAGRLLRRLGRDPEVWGILRADDLKGTLGEVLQRISADSGALAALGPIHEASFSFDTAEPMRVALELTAETDKDAMMVADVLKGAESLARLTLRETRPELANLMSDLHIAADTGLVRAVGSIPAADVETVARGLGFQWPVTFSERQEAPRSP